MLNSPMTSFKQTLLIALSLTLGACATTREQIETEIGDAVTNEVSAQPEAWITPANIGDVQVGWIAAFNDPTLTALVKEAQTNNKNLRAAAANVNQAWALARQAGSALQPQVGLTTGGTRSDVRGGGYSQGELSVGVQISWEADLWGRIRSGVLAQEASAQAVEADFIYAQHSLTLSMAVQRKRFGEMVDCEPSRFLEELPQTDLSFDADKNKSPEEIQQTGRAHLSGIRSLLSA